MKNTMVNEPIVQNIQVEFDYKSVFHPAQQQVFEEFVWDGGINVLDAGRRFGKSVLALRIILLGAMAREGIYWWVVPKYKMGNAPFRDLLKIAKTLPKGTIEVNKTDRRFTLINGSIIEFHSAESPQDLRSEGLRGLVMDEAAKIAEEAWTDALAPALTDYDDAWCFMISTPLGKNWFYKIWNDGQLGIDGIKSWRFKSEDNPFASKKKIARDKLKMPAKKFAQEHEGEFISESGKIFEEKHFQHRIQPSDFKPVMRFISADTSSTANPKSAYNCFVVGELDAQLRLFIREVYRFKAEYVELEREFLKIINKYWNDGNGLLDGIIIEYASSGISLFSSLQAVLPEEMSELLIKYYPQQSKEDRAREASVFMEKGRVLFPLLSDDNEWFVEFENELLAAPPPKDGYMDQVDSFSNLCKVLYVKLVEGLLYSGKED